MRSGGFNVMQSLTPLKLVRCIVSQVGLWFQSLGFVGGDLILYDMI